MKKDINCHVQYPSTNFNIVTNTRPCRVFMHQFLAYFIKKTLPSLVTPKVQGSGSGSFNKSTAIYVKYI